MVNFATLFQMIRGGLYKGGKHTEYMPHTVQELFLVQKTTESTNCLFFVWCAKFLRVTTGSQRNLKSDSEMTECFPVNPYLQCNFFQATNLASEHWVCLALLGLVLPPVLTACETSCK